uniref:Polymerase nucleotidyl transferase domain-containing protein n=1 Tax=Skeletonema marinoi TaxID=267567 RepID=A0A7S2LG55_9STRA|mmetsp:Transcript_24336/g.41394  ORF Transcript_24336/g.41394 Transcript_24336/m.41394 type:complete len:621 (+) Transcript_24336:95-1957(+)
MSASSGHQSESMGRSSDDEEDDEEEFVPMKGPGPNAVTTNNTSAGDTAAKNEESFLDDDFLSFGHVDNGGDETDNANGDSNGNTKKKMAGRKRERPHDDKHSKTSSSASATPSIPWLDNSNVQSQHYPTQHQQHHQYGRNNRGYNNNNNHHNYHHNYTPPTPPLIKLHNEIVSFMKLMSPTPREEEIRTTMVQRITTLAHAVFGEGECEVLPFGSQVTGLALPGSDIDFVIRFPKKKDSKSGDDDLEEDLTTASCPLQKIADAVKTEFGVKSELEMDIPDSNSNNSSNSNEQQEGEKEHLSYLEVITQTRVPLVKFTIAPYNLDIDICFDQPHGPESADLMHRFMESMPPLRPLTFCLKYFLASREINRPYTGGIGSYLLQLMIVSFLQHRSRADLNRGYGGSGQHFNLGSLLLDFLELYGLDFNYVTTGISVRHDGYYFPKGQLDKKEYFWQPNRPSSIAVENPLDPTMDVGAGAYRIQMISRVFDHAFKTLLAYVSEPMEETDSILARILPPTEEMAKRRVLKDVMEGKRSGEEGVASEGVAAAAASINGANGGVNNDKQRGMKQRQKDKRNHSKNWDKNKDNKKRRHSSGGGGSSGGDSDHVGGKFKNKNKKKRYSK